MKLDNPTGSLCETREKSISRTELYALVWSTPLSTLAKQFAISDVSLGKVCKRHDIPRPGVGYWTQMRWGQTPSQTPLPPADDAELETITFHGSTALAVPEIPKQLVDDPELLKRIEFEQDSTNAIQVQERYSKYHSLLQLSPDKPSRSWESTDSPSRYVGFLRVSKSQLPRGRRLLNALFQEAEKRGFRVNAPEPPQYGEAELSFGEATIYLDLREPSRRITVPKQERKYSSDRYRYESSGKLELRIGDYKGFFSAKQWRDGKKKQLEMRLNEVLIECYVGIERQRKAQLERERWQAEYRAKEERNRLETLRQKQEQQRVEHLLRLTDANMQAVRIRTIADAIESRLANGEVPEDEHWSSWLAWARDYAARLDPLDKNTPLLEQALDLLNPGTVDAPNDWSLPRRPR